MSSRLFLLSILVSLVFSLPVLILVIRDTGFDTVSAAVILISFLLACLISTWAGSRSKGTARAKTPRAQAQRESGIVKWFNASKGFGFITRDSGDDVFVHFRSIRGEGHRVLRDGQRVEFAVSHGEKGLQAEDVSPSH
ncbi:MAG: cold-shock protein [Pseudomonadales bacterium]|nr:cold-shock protein [Pseudomonadales bacterium]